MFLTARLCRKVTNFVTLLILLILLTPTADKVDHLALVMDGHDEYLN
jgi:hypothetical protein